MDQMYIFAEDKRNVKV